VRWNFFPAAVLGNYLDADTIRSYCRDGCIFFGNNWSCPPHSPDFAQLDLNYPWYLVIIFSYDLNPETSMSEAFDKLKNLGDKVLSSLEIDFNRNFSIRGHKCEHCGSCPEDTCNDPDMRRYDFPSLGIDITTFMQEKMDYQVDWAKKDQSKSTLTSVGAFPLEMNEQMQVDKCLTTALNASVS